MGKRVIVGKASQTPQTHNTKMSRSIFTYLKHNKTNWVTYDSTYCYILLINIRIYIKRSIHYIYSILYENS